MPHGIYGILVPRPGIELMPPEVKLNHWTTREVLTHCFLFFFFMDKSSASIVSSVEEQSLLRLSGIVFPYLGFGSDGKESACGAGDQGLIPWRRKWQPTLVFLPGESHGQRSLVGYNT